MVSPPYAAVTVYDPATELVTVQVAVLGPVPVPPGFVIVDVGQTGFVPPGAAIVHCTGPVGWGSPPRGGLTLAVNVSDDPGCGGVCEDDDSATEVDVDAWPTVMVAMPLPIA